MLIFNTAMYLNMSPLVYLTWCSYSYVIGMFVVNTLVVLAQAWVLVSVWSGVHWSTTLKCTVYLIHKVENLAFLTLVSVCKQQSMNRRLNNAKYTFVCEDHTMNSYVKFLKHY